jgi:class 3 adenylate cyclase
MTLKGGRRAFRTVLFTDMVGSTELAAQLGDRRWRRTVAAHNALIRRELKRTHGIEVDTAGDGFFAVFENPTDALRCAAAVVAGVHGLGLRIRAGIHTGEVEPAGDKVGGIAVHIAARLLALAGPEEVLVSSTVRELVSGAGLDFDDRGVQELRGVPGEWHVFALVLPRLDESIAVAAADEDESARSAAARRQRLIIGGLLGVIAVLVVGIGAAAFIAAQPGAPTTGPDSVVAFEAGRPDVLNGWRIGRGPEAMALADRVLWVASTGAGTMSRIELGSGGLTSVGQGGDRPSAVHVAGNRVWVSDRYSSELAVLDAREGDLIDRLDQHAAAITEAAGRVWLADDLADRLVALDQQTAEEAAVIDLPAPAGVSDLVSADGALWAAAGRAGKVLRVDPASGAVEEIDPGFAGVSVLSAQGSDIWMASPATDTVARLEAPSRRVALRATVCDLPVALASTADGAWIVCAGDRSLWLLDRAGTALAKFALDGVPADVVADGTRAWVALRAD